MAIRLSDKKYFLTAALELIEEAYGTQRFEAIHGRVGEIIRHAGRNRYGNALPSWSYVPARAFFIGFSTLAGPAAAGLALWAFADFDFEFAPVVLLLVSGGIMYGAWKAIRTLRHKRAWRFVELWYRDLRRVRAQNVVFTTPD